MWVFTETGFVSAVRKPEEPKYITVVLEKSTRLKYFRSWRKSRSLIRRTETTPIGCSLRMRCLRPGCQLR